MTDKLNPVVPSGAALPARTWDDVVRHVLRAPADRSESRDMLDGAARPDAWCGPATDTGSETSIDTDFDIGIDTAADVGGLAADLAVFSAWCEAAADPVCDSFVFANPGPVERDPVPACPDGAPVSLQGAAGGAPPVTEHPFDTMPACPDSFDFGTFGEDAFLF